MKKGLPGEICKGEGGPEPEEGGAEVTEGRSVARVQSLPHPMGALSATYTSATVCLEVRGPALHFSAPSNHWVQLPRHVVLLGCKGVSVSRGPDPGEERWL